MGGLSTRQTGLLEEEKTVKKNIEGDRNEKKQKGRNPNCLSYRGKEKVLFESKKMGLTGQNNCAVCFAQSNKNENIQI